MQNCIISAVCLHGDKIALKSFVQIMLHWITMQNCKTVSYVYCREILLTRPISVYISEISHKLVEIW